MVCRIELFKAPTAYVSKTWLRGLGKGIARVEPNLLRLQV
jgi:hypothetical protein